MDAPSPTQRSLFFTQLKQYSKGYLVKKYENLDESATRLMVNKFLSDVLGYTQIDEIKTEYAIKGTYADYVIQLQRKKHIIVEVKAIQYDLSEAHLRQSISYAANEGVDWILLTNAKQFELYKVQFGKPITTKRIFSFDLSNPSALKESVDYLYLLSKKSVLRKELDKFWKRFQALEPINLAKMFYDENIIRILRKRLKIKTGINFSQDDIVDSIFNVIVLKIPSTKPKLGIVKKAKESKETIQENPNNNIESL